MSKVLIVYYSATGTTYQIAKAIEEGARSAGAETRLRKVKEIAPQKAIDSNKNWKEHLENTSDINEATHDDLKWADAIIMGSPTRYGTPTAQMKNFIDSTGPLWMEGALVNKICSGFTSASTKHGGHEATILAINTTFYHWGGIIAGPGYAGEIQFKAGNPYGTSFTSQNGELDPDETALEAANFQGKRVTEITDQFKNT